MEDQKFELYRSTFLKMARINILHRTIFERNISSMGIHHSQHCLLMYLAKVGEVQSQKQIAEKFGVTSAAIARSLKELESENYIQRIALEDDNRFNKIVITEKGKAIVARSHQMFKETDMSAFEDFSEEDIAQFNAYLDMMQSKLIEKNEENCCVRKSNEKE